MRLTAMFVARNGRQFLTQLMNREVRNYQFDFLKPQHSNFPYFTKLVEQYTKVGYNTLKKRFLTEIMSWTILIFLHFLKSKLCPKSNLSFY